MDEMESRNRRPQEIEHNLGGGYRWKRLVASSLLGALVVVLCAGIVNQGGDDNGVWRRISLAGRRTMLKSTSSYESWYRQQSADSWFGQSNFKAAFGKKKEHARWMTKEDLATLPVAERERADRKLKARLIQLSMDTMMSEDKSTRLNKALQERLIETYKPNPTEGDTGRLSEPTMMGASESETNLQKPSAEEKEKQKREQDAKDAAERALDDELEKANPKLQVQYEEEVRVHDEQNKKMDAVSRLLAALTNTTGYKSADISQCKDHCAEVIESDALNRAERAQEHQLAEKREEDELLHSFWKR